MTDTIAIDFGTSRIKVAYWNPSLARPDLMQLGQQGEAFWPSVAYLPADRDDVFWGSDAEDLEETDPGGGIETLKSDLRQAWLFRNRRRVSPERLLTALFSRLRDRAGQELAPLGRHAPRRAVLTRPALFGPVEIELITTAARTAGFERVDQIAEPVAAARAWLAGAGAAADEIVVFDAGGGTMDWACLRRTGQGFEVVPAHPPSGWQVGGHDIDQALLDLLQEHAGAEADRIAAQRSRYLRKVRTIKERHCRGMPWQAIEVGSASVVLSASDVQAGIEAVFIRQAVANLRAYLAPIPGTPPVLLVGGGSRLTGLSAALERQVGCEVVHWDRADYAVVLGAVPPVARPPPPPPPPPPVEVLPRSPAPWPEPGCVFRDWGRDGGSDPTLPEMVVIPAGRFTMGAAPGEEEREGVPEQLRGWPAPQHQVRIARAFALARTPVTRGEFRRFVDASGHRPGPGAYVWTGFQWTFDEKRSWDAPGFEQTDDHPVVCVNWNDARAYVDWLGERTGQDYRLPTEAEWEYACRAGSTTARFWGDGVEQMTKYAQVANETTRKVVPGAGTWAIAPGATGYGYTAPVGRFAGNRFGLHDMLGNVWEWCEDCWNPTYEDAPSDGSAWTTGDCKARVLRGGSWSGLPNRVRSAIRLWYAAVYRNYDVGFRLARTFPPES